jgi:hypothetical protein
VCRSGGRSIACCCFSCWRECAGVGGALLPRQVVLQLHCCCCAAWCGPASIVEVLWRCCRLASRSVSTDSCCRQGRRMLGTSASTATTGHLERTDCCSFQSTQHAHTLWEKEPQIKIRLRRGSVGFLLSCSYGMQCSSTNTICLTQLSATSIHPPTPPLQDSNSNSKRVHQHTPVVSPFLLLSPIVCWARIPIPRTSSVVLPRINP